ncbi:MAG: hypothetical protein RLZZ293_169 [Pseudomonadota bacterium]
MLEEKYLLLALISCLGISACSTTPNADNYTKKMNQPTVLNGAEADKEAKQLNKPAWNELKLANIVSYRINPEGNYAEDIKNGYLYIRANVINQGDNPSQAKWRCKFYDSNGVTIADSENSLPANSAMGLGWHNMLVYPIKNKSQTDDANLITCVAPNKLATDFRIEVHDTANDITIYK